MAGLRADFTGEHGFDCDGGVERERILAAIEETQLAADVDGAIDLNERLALEALDAALPTDELCAPVHLGCLHNGTVLCEESCSEQVAFYQELCYTQADARNASYDYNISSCVAPDGWRVGDPTWVWYAESNASDPRALPDADAGRWSYADVPDMAVLNCTCHWLNQTWDATFVGMMLAYNMQPLRDHLVSTCLPRSVRTRAPSCCTFLLRPPRFGTVIRHFVHTLASQVPLPVQRDRGRAAALRARKLHGGPLRVGLRQRLPGDAPG